MSVATAKVKLMAANRDLKLKWAEATQKWNDTASRTFEKNHLQPFEQQTRSAVNALDTMRELMQAMERECGQD